MKSRYHHSNTFVLEILLDILLLAVLLTVILNLFIRAHRLTNQTDQLHQAVDICASIADLYNNGDGTLESIQAHFENSNNIDNRIIIYFDNDFEPTNSNFGKYTVVVSDVPDNEINFHGTAINISCYDINNKIIYSLRGCHFKDIYTDDHQGGASHVL